MHQAKRSFHMLFNDHLVPGGHYVIEDICTSFVEGFDDFGPFQAPPTVDVTCRYRVSEPSRTLHFPMG